MNAPTTRPLDEVIAVLRVIEAPPVKVPTWQQVHRIVRDLGDCVPLAVTASDPLLAGFDEDEVLCIAEEFGSHRARVLKGHLDKPAVITADETGMLFPLGRAEQLAVAARPRKRRVALPAAMTGERPAVILPRGYERTAEHGRDVALSIRALIAADVSEAEVIRFLARRFAPSNVTLAADHAHLLHWLASRGFGVKLFQLAGLDENGEPTGFPGNFPLVALMVEAFDLLEVARTDAVLALTELVDGRQLSAAQVAAAARKARWLAAGELSRLEKLASEVAAKPENVRLAEILSSRVSSFARQVRLAPAAYVVTDVSGLNDGHLTQILASSGLLTDEADDKALTAELRARLTQLGMGRDLDREIPEGLRAFHAGRLEEFYDSRQARAEGDPDWKSLYQGSAHEVALS